MKIVSTFHSPSSVISSVKCCLSPSPELGHLVVAKSNRLEVFSINPDGLKPECELEIWGQVLTIKSIPVKRGAAQSNLIVLTDHPDPQLLLLSYAEEAGVPSLACKSHISLHDRNARPAEYCTDIALDVSRKVIAISCYTGKLKIVILKRGLISGHFDVSISELNLLALAFLMPPSDHSTLALLHIDAQRRLQLLSRDLDVENQELSPIPSSLLPASILQPGAFPSIESPPILIAIPPLASSDEEDRGGLLVLGGRKILFFGLASEAHQRVRRDKQRRLEKRKSSNDDSEIAKAKEKEKERESRKIRPKALVRWPWSALLTWCSTDADCRKLLLSDKYGRLCMMVMNRLTLILIPIGETSPATTLSYLSSQVLFVGSHLGDSQLLKIHPQVVALVETDTLSIPSEIETVPPSSLESLGEDDDQQVNSGMIVQTKGSRIEMLENYPNIAPIVDAELADTDGSGQPQIVTCSGGANTGSLNVIRTGADFNALVAIHGLSDVTNVWPIRSAYDSPDDIFLMVSTTRESMLFRLEGSNAVHRLDISCTAFASEPTLALANICKRVTSTSASGKITSSYVSSSRIVQVTPKGITLVEYDNTSNLFHLVSTWAPELINNSWRGREIVASSVNASQFVVALSGGRLAILNIGEAGDLTLQKHTDFTDDAYGDKEICSVSCAPFDYSKEYSLYIAVSFWGTNTVTILSLEKADQYMKPICESAALPSLPRSVLLHNFGSGRKAKDAEYHPHVLVGLADGTIVSFAFRNKELQDQKIFALGTAPVSLSACRVDDRRAVFASGSRTAMLYWDKQRLRQSPVLLKDIVTGTTLNSSTFSSCLILVRRSSLLIGRIRGVDKTQIRQIPMGYENPRRIAYHSPSNVFGVACLQITPGRIGEADTYRSTFSILDGSTFTRNSFFVCEPDEEVTAVQPLTSLTLNQSSSTPLFCVGTVRRQPGEREPSQGRLLIMSRETLGGSLAPPSHSLRVIASKTTLGCVYALDTMHDMVAAAVNSSVILYRVSSTKETSALILNEVTQWNHNYFVTSLIVREDTILIGDAISSVSVLKIEGNQLKTVARDYGPLWPVSVQFSRDNGVIGANCDCNLFHFSMDELDGRAVLARVGSYNIGDVVNKFLPGGLNQDAHEDDTFESEHLFFTASGRIGLILHVNDQISLHLTALQRNMEKTMVGPGGWSHSKWRAPTNARGRTDAESAFGFLDGDFLEQFLTNPHPTSLLEGENEAERINLPHAEIRKILEKLQSLH